MAEQAGTWAAPEHSPIETLLERMCGVCVCARVSVCVGTWWGVGDCWKVPGALGVGVGVLGVEVESFHPSHGGHRQDRKSVV